MKKKDGWVMKKIGSRSARASTCSESPRRHGTTMGPPQRLRFQGDSETSQTSSFGYHMSDFPGAGLRGRAGDEGRSIPSFLAATPTTSGGTMSTTASIAGTPSTNSDFMPRSFYVPQMSRSLGLVPGNRAGGGTEPMSRSSQMPRSRGRLNATVESVADGSEDLMESRFRGLTMREGIPSRAESIAGPAGRPMNRVNGLSQPGGNGGSARQRLVGGSGRLI
jgi:hypothetical protein